MLAPSAELLELLLSALVTPEDPDVLEPDVLESDVVAESVVVVVPVEVESVVIAVESADESSS